MLNFRLSDRNSRQMRNAANGGSVNGHYIRPQPGN
jgi:hypothetical protein